MNPWLVTWKEKCDYTHTPIAGLLHNQSSFGTVCGFMESLYFSLLAICHKELKPSWHLRHANRKISCQPVIGQHGRIQSKLSPILYARLVYNLKVKKEKDGHEVMMWEEGLLPRYTQETTPREISKHFNHEKRRPKKRLLMSYSSKTYEISFIEELDDDKP